MNEQQKPIGFWLKEADQAISECFDQTVTTFGLSRLGWQILNLVQQAQTVRLVSVQPITSILTDSTTLRTTIEALIEQTWLTVTTYQADLLDCELAIHPAAIDRFAELTSLVHGLRQQLMRQITPDEYQTTIRVLAQMIKNAEVNHAA